MPSGRAATFSSRPISFEREGGVELHVAGVVLLLERALGFQAAGAEVDAGALDVDVLSSARGGDVGGDELRAGAQVERDGRDRRRGCASSSETWRLDVRGGVRLRRGEIVQLARDDDLRLRAFRAARW